MVAMSAPVLAQQPGMVNPTADAVKEQQLLQQLKTIQGRGTIPDVRSYVLEHPVGRNWQQFHSVTLRWIGGIAIVGMLALLVVFYLARGMVRLESGRSGRKIVRSMASNARPWMTATCFIILAITGLNVTLAGCFSLRQSA
jgi:formate dehydrogenase subunit gamma